VQNDIPDPSWITRRFDTVADEALEQFCKDPEDINSWPQTIEALYHCALGVMGTNATDLDREELRQHRERWVGIAKDKADIASMPGRKWSIGCTDKGVVKELQERVERLAAHAAETELNTSFELSRYENRRAYTE
jgi:hypothetical protein